MARLGLLGRHRSTQLGPGLQRLASILTEHGHTVVWDANTARDANIVGPLIDETCFDIDMMVSYGGDGTVLSAARRAAPHDVPVLAIHKGNVGFLADFSDADEDLDTLLQAVANPTVERRLMLEGEWIRGGQVKKSGIALNDVLVARGMSATLIEMELIVNGRLVSNQRADGFIISTPVGSTAYNVAAGGPILLPSLDAIALTPICPYVLSNRPVVVDGKSRVTVRLKKCQDSSLHFDGQNQGMLQPGDEIRAHASEHACLLVVQPHRDRFAVMREKMGWNA